MMIMPEKNSDAIPKPACRHAFTLVELLAVLVIMAIIMGMAVAVISSGSGVDAAARMLGTQLGLARQHAIANRARVALVLPEDDFSSDYYHASFRAAVHDSATGHYYWLPNSSWTFLPATAVIWTTTDVRGRQVDIDENRDGTVITPGVRAVVFRPTGALDHTGPIEIVLIEGFVPPGSATPQQRNLDNNITITVDKYTGRASMQ